MGCIKWTAASLKTSVWLGVVGIVLLVAKANAELPLQPDRTLQFTVNEVTWLAVDVSPDGEQLVMEVLGDLYTLPIAGGQARPLLTGMAFDSQPVFSPDGRHIAFISDRSGSDNVWLLELGSDTPRQLSKASPRDELKSPSWSPDGQHVVVSRGGWVRQTNELWAYPVNGGTGVQLTKAKAHAKAPSRQWHNALGAVYDATGRYLYYARKLGGFAYDMRLPAWQIARRDLQQGKEDVLTAAPGSAMSPQLSADGRWLAYATRYQQQTGLRLRDLHSGEDEWLAYPVERDDQEARFTRDLMPNYTFTPDSQSLITSRNGRLIRVALADKSVTPIPFTVPVKLPVADRLAYARRVGLGPVKARVLADLRLAADGNRVAFAALGRIYVHHLDTTQTRAVSPPALSAAMPAWSPDGKHLAYVAWQAGEGGVYRQRARAKAKARRVNASNGYFTYPLWSADGEHIVALRGSAHNRLSREGGWGQVAGADLVWLPAKGGTASVIMPARGLTRPHLGPEQDRIYVYKGDSPLPRNNSVGLVSVRYDGSDRRDHLSVTGAGIYSVEDKANPEQMFISPTGEHVVFKHAHQLYVAQILPFMQRQKLSLGKPVVPLYKLTDVGADFVTWDAGGQTIAWSSGDQILRRALASIDFTDKPDADSDEEAIASGPELLEMRADVQRSTVDIYLPRAEPNGRYVLRGAKLISMGDDGIIEDSVIVVNNNRIEAVGAAGSIDILPNATVFDVSGKTITPGFVDTHAHFRVSRDVIETHEWSLLAHLAYGVTTGMDVQPTSVDLLEVQDRLDAGALLGPRAYSTGPGIFSNNDIQSYAHALAVLTRYKERYQVHNLKAYIMGNRQQRQWLVQAARELKLMPTTEGALDMRMNLTFAIDGFSGLEHNFPLPHLYQDVVQLAGRTGLAYTPTLLVNFGGPQAENQFFAESSPYEDRKLRRFTPYDFLARRSLRRAWFHPSEMIYPQLAASARRIVDAGGQVGVGSHGQLQGLGYHWEMWALASGGFDNLDVLRSATLMGAQMLGIDQDLGSVQPGKLADLLVFNSDPSIDIRHSTDLQWVIKNGEIYNAESLDQIWPEVKPLPDQWWWHGSPQEQLQ